MCVRLGEHQLGHEFVNAALHGIVEEEEYRALGLVEANLNREAGIFELAR